MAEPLFLPQAIDLDAVFQSVAKIGAASLPLLDDTFRRLLVAEAEQYSYRLEEEIVGSGENQVHQQLGSCEVFPAGSLFRLLSDSFQGWLDSRLDALPSYPFSTPLCFDSFSLQRYPAGSIGITPHRDGWRYINLICIFVISGKGRFYVCADRAGSAAVEIAALPGSVILMRAPGFLGANLRPFHYVTGITGERYSFGMRQLRNPGLEG
jgi:hypothetical protein